MGNFKLGVTNVPREIPFGLNRSYVAIRSMSFIHKLSVLHHKTLKGNDLDYYLYKAISHVFA